MRGGMSVVRSTKAFIEFGERPTSEWYDETHTVLSIPIHNLRPDTEYEFGLNTSGYENFKSEAGIPLKPAVVTFTTGTE